ncbi:MAG: hypothetical protein ACK4ZD_02170 [Caldimonas sp.]|uniref:hypothetical protein n=1 Tax=Caldimonas sp. TaxID=2838790 RepID=UPI00391D092C
MSRHARPSVSGPWRAGVVLALAVPLVAAQPVYRCGNQYSDRPCPDARVRTDLADPRTPDQQRQAMEHSLRQGWTADELEQERLRREEALRAAQRLPVDDPPPRAAASDEAHDERSSRRPKDYKVRLPKPPKPPRVRPASR